LWEHIIVGNKSIELTVQNVQLYTLLVYYRWFVTKYQ